MKRGSPGWGRQLRVLSEVLMYLSAVLKVKQRLWAEICEHCVLVLVIIRTE